MNSGLIVGSGAALLSRCGAYSLSPLSVRSETAFGGKVGQTGHLFRAMKPETGAFVVL